jgi:mannose-6-phosphate isomerase-like protein (cupin superfamily)
MDAQPYDEEVHDYDEALLVIEGRLLLKVADETVTVRAGQMYLAPAGTPHSVLPGSHGSLVIVDI